MNSGPGVRAATTIGLSAAAANVMVWENFIVSLLLLKLWVSDKTAPFCYAVEDGEDSVDEYADREERLLSRCEAPLYILDPCRKADLSVLVGPHCCNLFVAYAHLTEHWQGSSLQYAFSLYNIV